MTAAPLWRDLLSLGRVSNLPTVWTNALAALVLAGSAALPSGALPVVLVLLVSLTLFYIGGMYLNDAFDAEIDARERPERPIPAGRIGRGTVFGAGFAMLAAGVLLLVWASALAGGGALRPALGGLALAAAIVFYDWHHKANVLGPVVMGLCRFLVYLATALAVAPLLPMPVLVGGALLWSWVIGLTYVAKQETLGRVQNLWPLLFLLAPLAYGLWRVPEAPWTALLCLALAAWILVALRFIRRRGPGDIPRAVVSLIAGISLVDAVLIAAAGASLGPVLLALAGFGLTLFLQRWISGT